MYADVIVDIAHSEVDRIFEYCAAGGVKLGGRVLVPFGNMRTEGYVIGIKDTHNFELSKIKSIIKTLDDIPALTEECIKLAEFMALKYHCALASCLRLFIPSEMRKGRVKEKFTQFACLNKSAAVTEMLENISKTAKAQREIINFLSDGQTYELSGLNKKFGGAAVKALINKNYILTESVKQGRVPYKNLSIEDKQIKLNSYQENALKIINENNTAGGAVSGTSAATFLIHGVTGSGKTEVYLNLIAKAVENGKSAIMLVPEIALTPQMLAQLRQRFGSGAALLHSGLSAGERFDEWWRIRRGEAKIVIGARSAVFAPCENLGVIIIDEEHDGSYFSEITPRYSTLELAQKRAKFNNCKLILGSATPSVGTYQKAVEGGYKLIEMPQRINQKPLPEIIIADMRREIRRGNPGIFSAVLKEQLEECLNNKDQALLFLNRRGFSQIIICEKCGYVAKCRDCDVSLIFHMDENLLKCHYCNLKYNMLDTCPSCGSGFVKYKGIGTEKIVYELKKLYPNAKIARMDNDTTKTKEGHYKILEEFRERKIDILVGTQMITKGHDFPAVTLVGIIDGDMSLHFADYRSGERTFQLITQVAGRSGRAGKTGKVVLQTFTPNNFILDFALRYNYKGFFEREIALRETTQFPPFSKIIRILISSEHEKDAAETLKCLYDELKLLYDANRDKFIFFNKMKSPIKKLESRFRYQTLMRVKNGNDDLIDEICLIANRHKTKNVNVTIEENPANMF